FFDKYNWYTNYQRNLSLQPDIEKIGQMLVYNYRFVADELNSLTVIIDRFAKRICGFEKTTPEGKIVVKCLLYNNIGYAGYKETPIEWIFENTTKETLNISIDTELTSGITFTKDFDKQLILNPGENKIISSSVYIDPKIPTRTNPKDYHDQAELLVKSLLKLNEETLDLTVGIIPVDPLEITIAPELQSLVIGENTNVQIRAWNRSTDKLKGIFKIGNIEGLQINPTEIPYSLDSNQSIEYVVNVNIPKDYIGKLIELPLDISVIEKEISINLPQEKIFFPILETIENNPRCTGYIYENNFAILENDYLRVKINLKEGFVFKSVYDKRKNTEYWLETDSLDIGLPFRGYNNELVRAIFSSEIIQEKYSVSLKLSYNLKEKEGLKIQRIYTLKPNSEFIEISFKILNESLKSYKNISLRNMGHSWMSIIGECKTYFPLKKGILQVTDQINFNNHTHFPSDPKEFSENWICTEFDQGALYGIIWSTEYCSKILIPGVRAPSFHFNFGDIAPNQNREAKYYLFFGRGNLIDFRNTWRTLFKKESQLKIQTSKDTFNIIKEIDLAIESSAFGKINDLKIHPINKTDTLKISLINNTKRILYGKVEIELPMGLTFENGEHIFQQEYTGLTDEKPLEISANISAIDSSIGRIFPIKLNLYIPGSKIYKSFFIQILDKDYKISIDKMESEESKELIKITNGRITFETSKDHYGSVISLKVPSLIEPNNLISTWPKVKPFLWESHSVGGICPIMYLSEMDDSESMIYLETFNSELITKGLYKGVRFFSDLFSDEKYRGLRLELDYTTLPQANSLKATFRIINNTDAHQKFKGGISAMIAVNGKVDNDIYFKSQEKTIKRTYHNEFFLRKMSDKWVVFIDPESKIGMAVLGPDKDDVGLMIFDQGEFANGIDTYKLITIPPRSKIEYNLLFVLYPLHHDLLDHMLAFY
ncbi:MAG: hypothetical protein ACFFDW_12535, partial [Candidatus Thorarchaeota archaeon]